MFRSLTFFVRATRKVIRHPAEALLLLRMAGWVLLLSIAVRVFSLPRSLRLLSTTTRFPSPMPTDETQRRLGEAIDLLLKTDLLIFKPICWKRAALLHRYLALNGIATRILFGMRRESDGSLGGHAWLETSSGAILEDQAPNYAVTYAFPSGDAVDIDLKSISQR